MKKREWVEKFDANVKELVTNYVDEQDFHTLETPLKSQQQYKIDLKEKLMANLNFASLMRGYIHSIQLIEEELMEKLDAAQLKKTLTEIAIAFERLGNLQRKYSDHDLLDQGEMSTLDLDLPLWTALYGISTETLMQIYEIVSKYYHQDRIDDAKDLLQTILLFAPTISSFWNALGFCCQQQGNFEQAINYFTISEEVDPNFLETYFYLARCYMKMNQKSLAKRQAEKLMHHIQAFDESQSYWLQQVKQLNDELSY